MALEIIASLICDGCGKQIVSEIEHRSTRAASAVWEVQHRATDQKWTTVNRGRYHVPTHWCEECSNKPMKPVPRKVRKKKPRGTD